MTSFTTTISGLMTAEEFAALPEDGMRRELIAGRVHEMTSPGTVIFNIAFLLKEYLKRNDIGRAWGAESGLVTARNPDTVRGMDAAFISYGRRPRDEKWKGLATTAPEIVFEVLSPEDHWPKVLKKIADYLDAGVLLVCTLDPEFKTMQLHTPTPPPTTLQANETFRVPEILPGFECKVSDFFEDV